MSNCLLLLLLRLNFDKKEFTIYQRVCVWMPTRNISKIWRHNILLLVEVTFCNIKEEVVIIRTTNCPYRSSVDISSLKSRSCNHPYLQKNDFSLLIYSSILRSRTQLSNDAKHKFSPETTLLVLVQSLR